MNDTVHSGKRLDWLLDNLVEHIPEIQCAVVLSGDGLLIGKSKTMHREDAEHLSAVASGVHALARGASDRFQGGPVQQSVIQMERAVLFITTAGAGARLAAIASHEVDLGMLAYEMATLVRQVGHQHLTAAPRIQPTPVGPPQDG